MPNYNVSNDAFDELEAPISKNSNIILLKEKWDLFPVEDFIIKIEKRDTTNPEKILRRENILIANRVWNTLNVATRNCEAVPMSSESINLIWSDSLPFNAGDTVSLIFSAKMYDEFLNSKKYTDNIKDNWILETETDLQIQNSNWNLQKINVSWIKLNGNAENTAGGVLKVGSDWFIDNNLINTSISNSFELSEDMNAWQLVELLNNWSIDKYSIEELGLESTFNIGTTNYISAVQVDTNRVFIAYQDEWNGSYWTWIVATISWNSISYWSKIAFNLGTTNYISAVKIDTDKVLIAFQDAWNVFYWTCVVATISWTSITYWIETMFSGYTYDISAIQIDTNKVFISYRNGWNSHYWTWIVATISWTWVLYGTETVFKLADTRYISAVKLDTDKVLIAYQDAWYGSSWFTYYWMWIVATISWTSITYGTETAFNLGTTNYISAVKIDTDKVLICYNSNYWAWIVATISWTWITYWSEVVFNSTSAYYISLVKLDVNKVFIAYNDDWNYAYWTGIITTISWTSITYWSKIILNAGRSDYISAVKIDTDKVFIGYRDEYNNYYWTWVIYSLASWWKLIWILQENWVATETKKVAILWQVSKVHSWLTPWTELPYWIALSDTEILVKRNY